MPKEHILIVEDEEDILELVSYNLIKEGFQVTGTPRGEDALPKAIQHLPDLILLDLMLPGIDGFEVCRRLKAERKTETIPIIMLTAKGEEADIVTGLKQGADDYITKPFSPKVLVARIKTVLRRESKQTKTEDDTIQRGDLTIHMGRREVLVGGKPINLTLTEFRILHYLANKPGWVFTRDQIVNGIHDDRFSVTTRSIDVQIVALRKKLGGKDFIETVRGVGYRFKD